MIDPVEIFRRETALFGRPLLRERMPEAGRKAYAEFEAQANDLIAVARRALPALPPIHFDFILDGSVNAVAFKAQGHYFIGLNTGTLFLLRLVICRMLADRRLFRDIGDPEVEADDLPLLAGYHPDADLMNTGKLMIPRDPVRYAYAAFLQHQAMLFFVGHELAHITRGHVDYAAQAHGLRLVRERGDEVGGEDARIERQCLEQDADRRSIVSRIDSFRVTLGKKIVEGPPWAPSKADPARLLGDWYVSLNVAFRLFGESSFAADELLMSYYPPVALRYLDAQLMGLWSVQHAWDAGLVGAVRQTLRQTRIESEVGLAHVFGREPVSDDEIDLDAFRCHSMLLQDYWSDTLLAKLRPHAYEFGPSSNSSRMRSQ